MCGRYVAATSPEDIAAYFDVDRVAETLVEPNYNVAPTLEVPVVREREDHRILDLFVWGLVPFWAKDRKIGSKMINARAETVASNGAFKHAFAKRRCIIPADGFYEWTKVTGPAEGAGGPGRSKAKPKKQPWYISTVDGSMLAFAGLYEYWRGDQEHGGAAPELNLNRGGDRTQADLAPLLSCSIITTTANARIEPIHDRMPVVLNPSDWDLWLNPDYRDADHLVEMLRPAPAELFAVHKVSTAVNNARNSGPALCQPIDDTAQESAAVQGTLL